MRAVLVLVFLGCAAGCGELRPIPPVDDDPWLPGDSPRGCDRDSECPTGQVCPRSGGCTPVEQVRAVHVTWTLSGRPANRTTCDATLDLHIRITTLEDIGPSYSPVPCSQGRFTVDKLPRTYSEVQLGVARMDDVPETGTLDPVTGELAIDLPY